MNDPRSTNAQLDSHVMAAVKRFAKRAPEPNPWPLLRRIEPFAEADGRRWAVPAAAAAVAVGGLAGVVALTGNTRAPGSGGPDPVSGVDVTTPTTVVTMGPMAGPRCGSVVFHSSESTSAVTARLSRVTAMGYRRRTSDFLPTLPMTS